MNRYLVVANQTLESPQLREAIQQRMYSGPSTFHLLVPIEHGHGWVWDEGQVAVEAEHRLTHAIATYSEMGAAVRGEVGVMSPVEAVDNVLRGLGTDYYAEIIISTLPAKVSKWVRMDAPSRLQRSTTIPVVHVVAEMAETNETR